MNKLFAFLIIWFHFANLSAQALYPDFSQLQGQFWIDSANSQETEEYVEDLLNLCRQWFSGMIYGYNFYYRPSDRVRRVEELFILDPIYQIPWGDSRLEYIGYVENEGRIEMSFRYFTEGHEIARLKGWRSLNLPNSSGLSAVLDQDAIQLGRVPIRTESFSQAVKEAIRNYFRAVSYSKPEEIVGRVALLEMPRSSVTDGFIRTLVKVSIDLDRIVDYRVF